MAFYNEFDRGAAESLRQLIALDQIPGGVVSSEDIRDVAPISFAGYKHCHFFAGIGGWAYAQRLAGWPDSFPLWSASLPCQPFSQSGKKSGFDDDRHLWPAFFWHVRQCLPPILVGEQAATALALDWWDRVANDLENAGYSCAAFNLPACSVGAPHLRKRLFWVAYSNSYRSRFYPETYRDTRQPKEYQCSFWSGDLETVRFADQSRRPIQRGLMPLVDGVPRGLGSFPDPSLTNPSDSIEARNQRIKGYGGAIVPQLAAIFLQTLLEQIKCLPFLPS